jgi:hypothetical protein
MSLKVFHVIFISLAILLAVGCAIWSFANEVMPAFGWTSAAVAIGLVFYEVYFLRKARRIIT